MTHYSLSKIHYLYMDDILHKIFVYRLVLPVAFFIMYLFPLVFFVRHYKDKLNIKFSYWKSRKC
jgi:hypothetical protein